MSSTVVYEELIFSQQPSSSLSLKLSNPSKLTFSSSTTSHSNNNIKCGWSAIEALSCDQKQERESEYVHPLAKRWSNSKRMSQKSLEMCTESLGSETGSFFTESSLYFPTTTTTMTTTTINSNNSSSNTNSNRKLGRQNLDTNNESYKFPPPLTTMRGSNSLQVRPYREDGRLVIEAVSAPTSHSCLRVERSDGRLRMSLVRQEEEVEEEEEEAESGVAMEGNLGINIDDQEEGEEREEMEEEEEEEEQKEEKEDGVKLWKDINGIGVEFRGKMGKEEFQRASCNSCRCKEGGRGNIKGLINWEPFWVAT